MAAGYTATTAIPAGSVFGNMRVHFGTVTLDATSGSSKCDLDYVYGGVVTPKTAATAGYGWAVTASGYVNIYSGATSDVFNVIAFGK